MASKRKASVKNIPSEDNNSTDIKIWVYDITQDLINEKDFIRLWGKIEDRNVCIKIRDVKRILHVVPKKSNLDNAEKDNMYDLLYTEVEAKLSNLGITHRESRLMRINHVFDYLVPDVTRGNIEVVEMSFLASQHPTSIPIEAKGKTYSYIFGLDDSPITSFLLLKDIRGPKWISIVGAKHSSDCISGSCRNCSTRDGHDFECSVDDVFPIRGDNSEMPDIKVMLLIPLVMNHQTSKGFICGWINSSNITTPLNDQNINAIQYFDIDLVGTKDSKSRRCNDDFLTYISTIDPDIICGHGIADILYELIYSYKNTEQSKFSVLGRRNKVTSQTEVKDNFRLRNSTVLHYTQGRILVDSRSFSAKERAKPPFDIHVLLDFYEDKPNHHTILKAYTSYINKSSILGTTYYFSKKVGNTWTDNLWSPSSFREEFLLHRIYYRSACLIPNKRKYTKQDEKVTGGFNEKPKSGIFTTYTALLDYEAYYPTIICENELCFSTVDKDMIKSEIVTHSTETKKMTLEPILPKELRTFIQDRKYLKGLLANPELPPDEQASTKSLANALKLCVNGLYGCFNLPSFRFYNPKFASFITKEGQKRIKDTIKFVKEDLQKQILFASTDSILVDTNTNILNEANSIADKICEVMNSGTNDIKLKVECFFKPCMVHSAMNKYIGKKILITEEEIKTDLVTKPKLDPLGCPPVVTSIVKDSINKFLHFIENNKNYSESDLNSMIQSLHDEGKDALLNTWDPVQFVMQNRVSEDIFFNKKSTAKKKNTDQDNSNLNIISNRMSALSDEIINLKLNIPDGTCLGYIVTNNFNQESNTCDYSIIHPLHFATDNKYQIDYKWYLDHKLQSKLDSYLILEKSAPSKPGSTVNDNKDYYAELRNPEFIANAISKRLTAAYSTEFNRSIEELNKDPYVLSEMRKKK